MPLFRRDREPERKLGIGDYDELWGPLVIGLVILLILLYLVWRISGKVCC
jgi:hypothetical protein